MFQQFLFRVRLAAATFTNDLSLTSHNKNKLSPTNISLSLTPNHTCSNNESPPASKQRRLRLVCYATVVAIVTVLILIIFRADHSNKSYEISSLSSTSSSPDQGKPSIRDALRNVEEDLNEVALDVSSSVSSLSSLNESFFVVWNRVFMLAADVAPMISREYRDLPDPRSHAQFLHHFEHLLLGKDPRDYIPLHPRFQFVSGAQRFVTSFNNNNKNDDGGAATSISLRPFFVFVSTNELSLVANHLQQFSAAALRNFVLVSGWTDPGPSSYSGAQYLLSSPHVLKWWAQNCDLSLLVSGDRESGNRNRKKNAENKMQCLPIGIDWHTIARAPRWGLPKLSASKQVDRMKNLANVESRFFLGGGLSRSSSSSSTNKIQQQQRQLHAREGKKFTDRTNKILLDFALGSNTGERTKTWLNLAFLSPLCSSPWTTSSWWPRSRDDVWRNYLSYRFVLSPPGNGYECHRTYEAMILGAIPIVQLHHERNMRPTVAKLYEDLPVVFVEDFSCENINGENMKTWNAFGKDFWSNQTKVDAMRRKLTNSYWLEKIRTMW